MLCITYSVAVYLSAGIDYRCAVVWLRLQVPLEELLDDLEGLNIGSEGAHAHAQHSASDVEMMTE
jgi:hypothetical protein